MILTLRKFSLCFSFFSLSFFSDFLSLSGFSFPLSLYCSVTDSILSVIDLKNNYVESKCHKYTVLQVNIGRICYLFRLDIVQASWAKAFLLCVQQYAHDNLARHDATAQYLE